MNLHKFIILFLQALLASFQKLLSLATLGEWPPFCSTLAIIERDNELLVIDRTDGQGIFFPGGFLKTRETPEQAIVREIREETGLEIKPVHLLGAYALPKQKIKSVILCYACSIESGTIRNSSEGTLFWIDRTRAATILHKVCQQSLTDYENYRKSQEISS